MADNKIINALASDVRASLAKMQASRKLLAEGHINYRSYEESVRLFNKACNAYVAAATKAGA